MARVEGTCGAEKDVIVIFKYEMKEEAVARILKRAQLKNSIAGIIYELTYNGVSFRLYANGKAIFRRIKNREELNEILATLLALSNNYHI